MTLLKDSVLSDREFCYRLLKVDQHDRLLPTAAQYVETSLQQVVLDNAQINALKNAYTTMRLPIKWEISEPLSHKEQSFLLAQYAPCAVLPLAWLQHAFQPLTSHLPLFCLLLKQYSAALGDGVVQNSLSWMYQELLTQANVISAPFYTRAFFQSNVILDISFELPALLLAISQFPQRYLPEILGIHLYMSGANALLPIELLSINLQSSRYVKRVQAFNEEAHRLAVQSIRLYFEKQQITEQDPWQRIWRGFALCRQKVEHWQKIICHHINRHYPDNPTLQMLELLKHRAKDGIGYHRKAKLESHSLDEWFQFDQSRTPQKLLAALAKSHYVKPGDADNSMLIKRLIAFEGPMFRIFTEAEIQVIRAWINALPGAAAVAGLEDGENAPTEQEIPVVITNVIPPKKLPLRVAYYRLLHIDQYPEMRGYAFEFVKRWLGQTKVGMFSDQRKLPFEHYDPTALQTWILAQHAKQLHSYQEHQTPPEKAALVKSCVRLCPLIYIDGAWIHKMATLFHYHSAAGAKLAQIFWDEAGNGNLEQHHHNVYRELITSMGVQHAEFGSKAFCQDTQFEQADFEVPVFWLSIALHSSAFQPEILGMNLAMELSGVGGAYRSSRDALKKYGFSARFVDLHNSIDNVSSGHTAWALEAIENYMDEKRHNGANVKELNEAWHRLWLGYRALQAPKGIKKRVGAFCNKLLSKDSYEYR